MYIMPVRFSKLIKRYNIPKHLRYKKKYDINNFGNMSYYFSENLNKLIRDKYGSRLKITFYLGYRTGAEEFKFIDNIIHKFINNYTNKGINLCSCLNSSYNIYHETKEEAFEFLEKLKNNTFVEENNFDLHIRNENITNENITNENVIKRMLDIKVIVEHYTYRDDEHLEKLKSLKGKNKKKVKYLYTKIEPKFPYEIEIEMNKYCKESWGFRYKCIELLDGNLGERNVDYMLQYTDASYMRSNSDRKKLKNNCNRSFKFHLKNADDINIALMLFGEYKYTITKYITNESEIEDL